MQLIKPHHYGRYIEPEQYKSEQIRTPLNYIDVKLVNTHDTEHVFVDVKSTSLYSLRGAPMSSALSSNRPPLRVRVFLASPGDVVDERARALKTLEDLQYHPLLRGKITVETVAWDKPGAGTPMLASKTPQQAIAEGLPKPSECDIVIVIFWSRMGTPLPPDYVKPDGSRYLSGTEWEYQDALRAAEQGDRPQVLVYRRTEVPNISLADPQYEEKRRQWELVEAFFAAFRNPDGSIRGGCNDYDTPDTFEKDLALHLQNRIARWLDAHDAQVPVDADGTVPPAPEPPLWPGSPFPGLRAFGAADAPIFFGRGRETDGLVARLAKGDRFTVVVGASGSGKSSLVAAGLLPRLVDNAIPGSRDWIQVCFTPGELGDNPLIALCSGFKAWLEAQGRRVRDAAMKLQNNPEAIAELIGLALGGQPDWAEVLLFIDQFEELFTVVDAKYRAPFVDLIEQAVKVPRLRLVATLRADFYPYCVAQPALAELLRTGTYPVSAPGVGALFEMIDRPAARAGLTFEEGLVQRIVDDTGHEPGALPLMAFALSELYEAGCADTKLTHAAYEAFGEVKGAISQRAESTFMNLDAEAQATLEQVFRGLLEVEEADTHWVAVRRRARLSDITPTPAAARLVTTFTDARLLIQDREQDGEPVVEVAHEALLRNWPRLVHWIDKTADDLRLLGQLEQATADWAAHNQSGTFLWPRARWRQAQAMRKRLKPTLSELEQAFLRCSRRRSDVRSASLVSGLVVILPPG